MFMASRSLIANFGMDADMMAMIPMKKQMQWAGWIYDGLSSSSNGFTLFPHIMLCPIRQSNGRDGCRYDGSSPPAMQKGMDYLPI